MGATGTTVTASYTNQAGTAGQTTVATVFGGTNFQLASQLLELPLAAGDSGVRAVANVNLVATTGTAGNFGVTLAKVLLAIPVFGQGIPDLNEWDSMLQLGGCAPEILSDACLFWVFHSNTSSTGTQAGEVFIAEE